METMVAKLPQSGIYAKKNFHNVESMLKKLPQCGNDGNKTSTIIKFYHYVSSV